MPAILAASLTAAGCGGGDDDDDDDFDASPLDIDADVDDSDAATPDAGVPDAQVLDLIVTPDTLALTEGGASGTFTVALSADPGADFDVTITSSDVGAATASPTTLTFTSANFDTAQTVTVAPADDDDVADEVLTVTASGAGVSDAVVDVTVADDDDIDIVATPLDLTVLEGATATIAVTLDAQPSADVVVTAVSGDIAKATAAPAVLTFTSANWDVAQNITVTGVSDADVEDETTIVTLASTGLTDVVVDVTVTDDDALNIAVAPTTLTLNEGGSSDVLGVTLTQMPSADVIVTIGSSDSGAASVTPTTMTFTPSNFSVTQLATVSPVDDADTANETVNINFTSPGLTPRAAVVTVLDNDTQTIELSTATLTINEGDTGTFFVNLSNDPLGTVAVTIATSDSGAATASPTTLNFDSTNYSTPAPVVVTGVGDLDLANESVTMTVDSAVASPVTVDVTVLDDDVQVIEANPPSLTVNEGGMGTVGVTLRFMPAADVMVTVTSEDTAVATVTPATLTFTPSNYDIAQNITVTGIDDVDLVNDFTDVTLSSASVPSDTTVPITVTDLDVQVVVAVPGNLSLDEATPADTFDVTLSQMPGADVTVTITNPDPGAVTVSDTSLTFTPSNYDTAQTVTVTRLLDDDTRDESVSILLTAPSAQDGTVNVSVDDPDVQRLIVTPLTLSFNEGESSTFDVSFEFEPDATTSVSAASNDPGAVSVSGSPLSFTIGNYDTPQPITVTGVHDTDLLNEIGVLIDVTTAIAPPVQVSVDVNDDDTQDILVDTTPLTVVEDTTDATFDVELQFDPSGDHTVTFTSSSPSDATVTPSSFTFNSSNWFVAQTITVSGVSDVDLNDHLGLEITVSDTVVTKTIPLDVLDDDTQALIVTEDPLGILEGTSSDPFAAVNAGLNVSLAFMPDNPVTVAMTTDDPTRISMSPTGLTFMPGNYDTEQPVVVTVAEDIDTANEIRSVTATPSVLPGDDAFSPEPTQINITDNDSQQIVLNQASVGVCETDGVPGATCGSLPVGTDATTTFELQFDPLSDTTVTITSTDPRVTVSPTSFTFTGSASMCPDCWDTPQTLTVTANDDVDLVNNSIEVILDSAVTPAATLTVNVVDDDQQAIVFAPSSITVTEETGAEVYNVQLTNEPTNPIVVSVTTQDATIATTDVTSINFDDTNWNVDQPVTVFGTVDQDLNDETTGIEMDSNPGGDPRDNPALVTVPVTVEDNDVQTILIGGPPTDGTCADIGGSSDCAAGFDCIDNGEAGGICSFRFSMQEGGPTNSFTVRLEFPPSTADVNETVTLLPSIGDLSLDTTSILFDQSSGGANSWDVPVTVVVTATEEPAAVPADLDFTHELDEAIALVSDGFQTATNSVPTDVIDDEVAVIATTSYAGISGATNHTKRQNIRWTGTRFAITATDDGSGETVVGTDDKDLGSFTGATTVIGDNSFGEPVETAEFDGLDFGLFSNSGTQDIVFTRAALDLTKIVDQATVVAGDAAEFWSALDTTTDPADPQYGLMYRNTGVTDGLYFLTVDPDDGTPSGEVQISSSGALAHEKPNLHRTDSGWLALYTVGVEVHCVRLAPNGSPLSNDILSGFPGDGELVSSVYNGATVAAVYQHATGLFAVELNTDDCSIVGGHRRIRAAGVYPFTPFIAFNGVNYLVGFDRSGAPNQVGVLTLDGGLLVLDEFDLGDGERPSVEWLGDRWASRSAGSVDVEVGSFQTECNNGVQDPGEVFPDCGGAGCPATSCYETTAAGGFVRNWLMLGKFPNGFCGVETGNTCGCEGSISPSDGSVTAGQTWFIHEDSNDDIDLDAVYGPTSNELAYSHIYLFSPTSQTVQFRQGSDDGIRVWLNDTLVFNGFNFCRGRGTDQDIYSVTLNAGYNKVLVKVGEAGGGWGFLFRVTDLAGNPLVLPYKL